MRRQSWPGFTLIELLVVVSIISLLIAILLPSLAKARELARRVACAANLNGIGKGFYTYGVENGDSWPVTTPNSTMNSPPVAVEYYNMTGKYGGAGMDPNNPTVNPPGKYWQQLSTTRSMWQLVRSGTVPKSFICPSSGDTADNVDTPADYWDFTANRDASASGPDRGWTAGTNNEKYVSYGMQVPYGAKGRATNDADPRMVLAADKGPYGGVSLGNAQIIAPPSSLQPLQASPDEWMPYNSGNHGGQGSGEGQVVMRVDASAEFVGKPIVGVAMDNIYTAWNMNANQPDFASRYWGRRPSAALPSLIPAQPTDTVIYP